MLTEFHIAKCKKLTRYSDVKRAKISAIAMNSNGKIIAVAHNRRLDGHKSKWTQHAEDVLIQKLRKLKAFDRFDDIIILVMRINKNGIACARPCQRCQNMLNDYPITVFYTDSDKSIRSL